MPLLIAIAAIGSLTIAQMKDDRRVLIVSAPAAVDRDLATQRRILADWRQGGTDRDLSVVEVVGEDVLGAADTAAGLRRRYRLHAGFSAVLIGKDGGVKLRSPHPLTADALARTIDAMPMRKAGLR